MQASKWLNVLLHPLLTSRKIMNRLPEGRIRNILLPFPAPEKILDSLQALNEKYKGKRIFVFPTPSCPWGYMFQRPQQLARALSEAGYPVIYLVDTSFAENPDWIVRGLRHWEKNIYLFNDGLNGRLLNIFAPNSIVWQYWPHQTPFAKFMKLSGAQVIYDVIDHLSTFAQYPHIIQDHKYSVESADLVLASADYIKNEIKLRYNRETLLVPNGVVMDDFSHPKIQLWNRMDKLRKKHEVLVGYYGAISNWMDFELLQYCAERFPSWGFLIVGERYPKIKLPKSRNIYYWGRQNYERLPYLLKNVDVTIIPFLINNITLHTSPVKAFEYMAGGKPIVSTELPEVKKYPPILIATSKETFADLLEVGLNKASDKDYIHTITECASENTWNKRVQIVLESLEERSHL